jgi:predicted RND superfamily exporter protein
MPETILQAGVLDWYDTKLTEITDLVNPTLWLIGVFVVLAAYVVYRSWKKAAIAALGMAIIIALINNVDGIANMFEGEVEASAPAATEHTLA